MIEFREDTTAWPTLVSLAGCVCVELEASGLPGTCFCGPVPGPLAVLELCGSCNGNSSCGGQAWTRLVSEYPSLTFPSPVTIAVDCQAPMAYVIEVGIARCVPTGKANALGGFTPPSMDELLGATRLQMADKAAMRRAIQCCVDTLDKSYTLGNYTPITAGGGCGGGIWQVTVWSE